MIYTCGIYKITNPKGRIYVGKSIHVEKRWLSYKSLNCKQQTQLYNSLKKYGYENHTFDIIHICEKEELDNLEGYYINLFDCLNVGLNLVYKGKFGDVLKLEKEKIIKIRANKYAIQKRYLEKKKKAFEEYLKSNDFTIDLRNIKTPLELINLNLNIDPLTEEELIGLPF